MTVATRTQWGAALALAGLAHAALAAVFLEAPQTPGAQGEGRGGIEIALGPAGGAPGGADIAAQEAGSTVAQAEEPTNATVQEPPTQTREVAAPTPSTPELADAPLQAMSPADLTEPRAEQIDAIEEIESVSDMSQMSPTQLKNATDPSERESATDNIAQAPSEAEGSGDEAQTIAPSQVGANGLSGTQDQPDAGEGANAASAGGDVGAYADYAVRLAAWLERHKTYPRRSQRRREEGVGRLYLALSRDGRVLEVRIAESSGYGALDAELLAMVERAAPMPAFPDDMAAERMEYVLPVEFALR